MDSSSRNSKDYHEAIKNVVRQLKTKRNELLQEINNDEVEKAQVLGEMDKLKDRLSILDANLKKKSEFRKDYDKVIVQSEGHFVELMQKSEDFLMRARREALALCHAVGVEPCTIGIEPEPEKKPEPEAPVAVVAFQPPSPDAPSCINCAHNYTCTTVAVPYRANGL